MRAIPHVSRVLAAAFVLAASTAFAADGDTWTVSRFSGEVWLAGSDVQQASLKQEDVLKPGDTVRTGRNGRVLLKRGEEMIMLAPNSVVGIPAQKKEGLSTTIVQQAGTILLDVEKRNVKHFEVETPYLAAVVKGTQFRVTVNAGRTTVDVIRGQVEVSDFKSGQIAQVMAGQHAPERSARSNRAGRAPPRSSGCRCRATVSPPRVMRRAGRTRTRTLFPQSTALRASPRQSAKSGSISIADKFFPPVIGVTWCPISCSKTSARLEAGSVVTMSVRLPSSA